MENYLCIRQQHLWGTLDEAARCCNGWIRLWAPLQYGQERTASGKPVAREEWYRPGKLWRTVLVREEQTAEIERLLALCPVEFLSSTQHNPWLTTTQ